MGAQYVDISSHSGTPNLKAYRDAGHTDLMLKATEGTGYAWPLMQALAREWHSFGPQYRVGYYHWLYGTLSGSAQFAWFWKQIAPVWRAGDWMMTDFEDVDPSRWVSDGQHLIVLRDFDGLAAQHGPVHDYAPDWYLANLPLCRAWLRGRLVVASDYSHEPPLNRYGLTFVAHQFTDRATVPGFAGPVDCNRWLVAPPITPGDTLSAPTVQQLIDRVDADAQHVIDDGVGTRGRVAEMDPIVMGLHAYLSGWFNTLAGQADKSPDGTTVTSLTVLWLHIDARFTTLASDLAAIKQQLTALGAPQLPPGFTDAVTAAAERGANTGAAAGSTAALNGLTLTAHTTGGNPA